jgi:hypothetical protein
MLFFFFTILHIFLRRSYSIYYPISAVSTGYYLFVYKVN